MERSRVVRGVSAVMAQRQRSDQVQVARQCPLLGVKRTSAAFCTTDRRSSNEWDLGRRREPETADSEMAESWLAAESYDAELVKRMLSTRETVLLLIESAMPLPLSAAELDEVTTESRAIH